jgi:hypothetical protein
VNEDYLINDLEELAKMPEDVIERVLNKHIITPLPSGYPEYKWAYDVDLMLKQGWKHVLNENKQKIAATIINKDRFLFSRKKEAKE